MQAGRAGTPGRLLTATLLGLLGVAFCLHDLTARSAWIDEAGSIAIGHTWGPRGLLALKSEFGNEITFNGFLQFWTHLGMSDAFLRLPSVAFAGLSVVALYLLMERTWGRRAGVVAALLLVVNSSFVHFGQEIRGYSLLIALVTTAWLALVIAVEDDRRLAWAAWAGCMILASYTSMTAGIVLLAQGVALLMLGPRLLARRRAWVWGVIVLLALLPQYVFAFKRQTIAGHPHVPALTPHGLAAYFELFTGGFTADEAWWLPLGLAYSAAWAAGIVVAWRGVRGHARDRGTWGRALLVPWLVVTALSPIVVSLAVPLLDSRYAIGALPAAVAVAAVALTRLPFRWMLAATAAFLLLGVPALARGYHLDLDPWRQAVAVVREGSRPGDGIAFVPRFCRTAFDHYAYQGDLRTLPDPVDPLEPRTSFYLEPVVRPADLAAEVARHPRVWLVFCDGTEQTAAPIVGAGLNPVYVASERALRASYVARLPTAYRPTRTVRLGHIELVLYQPEGPPPPACRRRRRRSWKS